jgi:AcrR family transcriptional regulator
MVTRADRGTLESGPALRRLILSTSRQLLLRDGYSSLSMRKIARAMGYSATTIYLHFRSKDQLVHALISDGMELLKQKLLPVLNNLSLAPPEAIRQICLEYASFGLEHPGYYEIMYVLHPENLSVYPEGRYREARALIVDLSHLFARGIKTGQLRSGDPLLAANILWSQIHGVVSLLHASRFDRRLDREKLVQKAIDAAVYACSDSLTAHGSRSKTRGSSDLANRKEGRGEA